ncbi:ParB N-terminal domain-containing protein [Agrobacterium rhizogenes]|nr:ParB N-terminal domain-containing protein [Rhizobium rhizogenes]
MTLKLIETGQGTPKPIGSVGPFSHAGPFDEEPATQQPDNTVTIYLSALSLPKANMIRAGLDRAVIQRYAALMRAGTCFPPITVMHLDPNDVTRGFTLVDGWHRVRATQENDSETIQATVVTGEINAIRWKAYEANNAHGLPLKMTRVMKREIFRAYVKARKHLTGKTRKPKAYAEMARDLIGVVSERHLPAWMAADFPAIYRTMAPASNEVVLEQGMASKDINALFALELRDTLANARACIRHLTDGRTIRAALRQVEEFHAEITEGTTGTKVWPDAAHDETKDDF